MIIPLISWSKKLQTYTIYICFLSESLEENMRLTTKLLWKGSTKYQHKKVRRYAWGLIYNNHASSSDSLTYELYMKLGATM